MNIRDIPVVAIGPGSQPTETDGAELQYIDLPRGMAMYEPPSIPDPEAVENLTGARAAMDWLQRTLDDWQPGNAALADISALDPENRELVNQVLGEIHRRFPVPDPGVGVGRGLAHLLSERRRQGHP